MTSKLTNLTLSTPLNSNIKQYRIINNRSSQMIYLQKRPAVFPQNFIMNQLLTNRHNNKDEDYCLYLHRYCLQNKFEGCNYCIRHILHDRNAPFKQCGYVHPQTNKRCSNAARRVDRRDRDTALCPWHIKQFNLHNRRNICQQNSKPRDKVSTLKRKFEELEHYCPSQEHDHRRKNSDWELADDNCATISKALKAKITDSINVFQSQRPSEEDHSNVTLSEVLNLDSFDSDNESVESYMDDPLRHAGVYSAEEISHILRDKMLRLQTLYINMLNYYRYVLKNKMRQYYVSKKTKALEAKNEYVKIDRLKEEEDYQTLKAMYKYHNVWGVEKLVRETAIEIRRSLVEESDRNSMLSNFPKCTYKKEKDVEKCGKKCIPLSNYCQEHILYDPSQVLYRPCSGGSPPCLTPIISYIHVNRCIRHTQIKFNKSEVDKLLRSPLKLEPPDDNEQSTINDLENEPELFNSIEDIGLEIDSVGHENLFGLEQFDLDNNVDILS